MDSVGIAFEGVDEALRIPHTEVRLFGKPEAFPKRRMGVALAYGGDVEDARERAKRAAASVRPVATPGTPSPERQSVEAPTVAGS